MGITFCRPRNVPDRNDSIASAPVEPQSPKPIPTPSNGPDAFRELNTNGPEIPSTSKYKMHREIEGDFGIGIQMFEYQQKNGWKEACLAKVFHKTYSQEHRRKEYNIHDYLGELCMGRHVLWLRNKEKDTDGTVYFFLEYASQGTLEAILQQKKRLDVETAHRWFCNLIEAVRFIHHYGVAHLNLNPVNMFVTQSGVLKIAGFSDADHHRQEGNERLREEHDEENREGRLFQKPVGNPAFRAPECHLERGYEARPVDVWACAIVLVKMLTGATPWKNALANEDRDYKIWEQLGVFKAGFKDLIPVDALKLVKLMLNADPIKRVKPMAIAGHDFFNRKFNDPAAEE